MSQKSAKAATPSTKGGGHKSKGSFLARQARTRKAATEEELLQKAKITPEDVLGLEEATKGGWTREKERRRGWCARKKGGVWRVGLVGFRVGR